MNSEDIDLMTMGLPEAWNMYKIMSDKDELYRRARFGIKIKFDINDYLKGRITIKPKSGRAMIRGRNCSLEDFETELEDREKVIKEWLIENCTEEEPFTPRGAK